MGRIYDIGKGYIDLGNIKYIDIRKCDNDDCYLRIHLLKGSEYVYNPDTKESEFIKPIVEIYLYDASLARSYINDIKEEWEKYLESKEIDKAE